ncbi:MAG: aspartate/glutamate racemase family protein [Pyrinomonadaceae bacterium]
MALGILDWGIGGISIYKLIKEQVDDVSVIYLSDTGATPYGKMTRPELVARLNRSIEFLRTKGATHMVIGCNAASTAIPDLHDHGIPVAGMIEPAVALTASLAPARLGLIGGRRTVLSGVYRRAFAEYGIAVRQRIAQPLSALIESGDVGSDQLKDTARQILAPIRNCSHVLLACTHYPAITPVLKKLVSSDTVFIDPAGELLQEIGRWKLTSSGSDEFLTTGDAGQMRRSARSTFGVVINKADRTNF